MSLDPVVLFFVFGLLAGLLKSELKLPPALYETLSIILLLAIGLHGGVELAEQASWQLLGQAAWVLGLGVALPLLAFAVLRGLGFAYHIKATGGPPDENVDIRFEADGTVSLITGTQHIGQGHETTFPQILAHRLGIPNERIRLRQGDTDLIPAGGGHGSSRATYMGGTAIWRASDGIIAKGMALAADALEAAEADLLNRRIVTIPVKDWATFEAWASAPAREVPALRKLSKTRPVWQK